MTTGSYFTRSRRDQVFGYALADLLSVVGTAWLLITFMLVSWMNMKERGRLAQCSSNLQQIGRTLVLYSNEHADKLPQGMSIPGIELWWSYREQVKAYVVGGKDADLSNKVFACPSDRGYSDPQPFYQTTRFAHGSYPYNAVTVGNVPNIAGWAVHEVTHSDKTLLVMEWCAHAPLSWHKSRTGKRNLPFYCDAESVVTFVDGHVALTKMYYDGYNAAYTRDPIFPYNYRFSGK